MVAFQNVSGRSDLPPPASFERWVRAALTDRVTGEVVIRVVDRTESQALNRTYRGKDQPTNVLAFAAAPLKCPLPVGELAPIGDLVICAPVVRSQAQRQGVTEEAHWAHMVIHGCLHLLGCDHQTKSQARAMEGRETALLEALGFPDPHQSVR